jgi:predicted GNAT family N-acyltransferase
VPEGFEIRLAEWKQDLALIREVRETVFVTEQDVRPEEEWDGLDPECFQVLAVDKEERPIGTARLSAKGKIGRMAVLQEWRKRGVGSALLTTLIDQARGRGFERVEVDAQVRALHFYAKHGFVASGPEFMDARIPHRKMTRDL